MCRTVSACVKLSLWLNSEQLNSHGQFLRPVCTALKFLSVCVFRFIPTSIWLDPVLSTRLCTAPCIQQSNLCFTVKLNLVTSANKQVFWTFQSVLSDLQMPSLSTSKNQKHVLSIQSQTITQHHDSVLLSSRVCNCILNALGVLQFKWMDKSL